MAEKKIIELEVKNNLGSLKSQLREAQAEVARLSDEFGVTSKQVIDAAKRAADLKDRIEDANDAIQAFKGEGAFLATGKAINVATSGIAAYEGALGILGVESEKVQETLLKVQSAMALTQGLAGLEDAGRAFTQLGAVIKNQVITAFATLKSAIITTGIGVLVVAIGVLLPKIIEWADWTGRAQRKQEDLNDSLERQQTKIRESRKELERDLDFRLRYARALGKSDDELAKIKESNTKKTNASIYSEIEAARKRLKALREADLGVMASSREEYNELVKNNRKKREAIVQEIKGLTDSIKRNNEDLLIEQTEQNRKEKDIAITGAKDKKDVVVDSANDTAAKELEIEEKRIQNLLRLRDEYLNEIEQAESDYYDSKLSKDELEIQSVNDKYFRLIELAKEYNEDTKILEQAQLEELDLIRSKYNLKQIEDKNNLILEIETVENAYFDSLKTRQDLEVQEVSDKYFRLIELAKQNGEDTKILEQAQAQEITKIKLDAEKELNTKKVQMTQQAFSVIQGVADLFAQGNEEDQKKAFQLNKAVNIGQAIMNTAQGVTAALSGGGNLGKVATGLNFVEAGLIGTIGALNIAKIANTQFQGGDTASGTPTPTAPRTPSFDIIQAQPQMQLGALQQQPVKAYVVSGEVSTAQALDRNRVRNATF